MLGSARRRLATTFSLGGWLPIVHRAAGSGRRVALTFDDGPTPEATPVILDLLGQHGARATFFLCGARAAAHPELTAAIVAQGHPVYAHGFSHVRIDRLGEAEAIGEIARTEAVLCRFRPTPTPYLLRLPYGSGHRDIRVHRLMRRWRGDCQIAHWGYNFEDFRLAEDCATDAQLAAQCQAAVRKALASRRFEGSVALLHDNPFGAAGPLAPKIAGLLLGELLAATARERIVLTGPDAFARHSILRRCIRTVAVN